MTEEKDVSPQDHLVVINVTNDGPIPIPSQHVAAGEIERQAALHALAQHEDERRAAAQLQVDMNESLRAEAEGSRAAEWRQACDAAGLGTTR